MTPKLQITGTMFLVVLIAFAASASQAAAAESLLTPGASPAYIEGAQSSTQKFVMTGKISANAVTVKCTTSTLKGTSEGVSVKTVTVTPSYSGCTLAGLAATIATNSCQYNIVNTTTALTAKVSVVGCPSTSPLTIEVPSTGCIVTVENQGPLSTITFANNSESPPSVLATLNLTGINYEGNKNCPANIDDEFSNGDLTGSYLLKAYQDSGGVKGAQVALRAD